MLFDRMTRRPHRPEDNITYDDSVAPRSSLIVFSWFGRFQFWLSPLGCFFSFFRGGLLDFHLVLLVLIRCLSPHLNPGLLGFGSLLGFGGELLVG